MVDNKNESSNLTSYDDGLTFSHAFRVLLDKHLKARINGNYRDFSLIIPAMVNGAFSCELFFKATPHISKKYRIQKKNTRQISRV